MTVFDEAIVAGPAAAEGICVSCPFREAGPRVLGLEYARERARAEAAEARCEELRRAEVEARSVAGSLKWRLDKCRGELKAAGDEVKSVRRMAKNALALQAEVSRLEKLLSQAGVESGKRSTIMSLREENARLKKDVRAAKDRVGRIKLLERETGDLRFWLRGSHERLERIEARHRDEVDWLNKDIACLRSALGRSADKRNGEMASLRKQFERRHAATVRKVAARDRTIAWLRERNDRLRSAVVRATDLTASLRAKNALLRAEVQASQAGMTALASQAGTLEARLAKLRASRAVLSKTMFGRKSERRKKPRSERKRGRQPGSTGHGRTRRRGLEERTERRDPPKDACVCSYCGKPYAANGERSTTVVEIEVKAYTRKIVRPRRRRSCGCASSPFEVTAPPPARLFDNTPYGISVWVCVLFERFVCRRPLRRTAAWLADMGLAVSPGTLADSVKRFAPLFEPLAKAILAHQNTAALRHADETGWRVQALCETGRSSRAWLWTSVSGDAVYFHIDPSCSADVAAMLFGAADCTLFLVCDRYSAYKKLARELDGKVILQWCWAHQRRTFIDCAAGHVRLARWCEGWIERTAEIYRLNEARLAHYGPGLERRTPAFETAQSDLREAVDGLFADAEAELAGLSAEALRAKPLRSLLNHREGLCVFVDRPQVPMDNNKAERVLRGPSIGRRLSFGSDSEAGAKFTAIMYSVAGTLSLNGVDVRRWLQAWLTACANNGGKPPDDLSPWLPWSMSAERRAQARTRRRHDRRGRVPLLRARLHRRRDGAAARADRRPPAAYPPRLVEGVLPAHRLAQARRRAQGHDGQSDHAGHAQGRPDRAAAAEGAAGPAKAHRLRTRHRAAAAPAPVDPRRSPSARHPHRRARLPRGQTVERVRRPLPLSRIQDPGRRTDALRRPRPRRLARRHARLLNRRLEARPARQVHRMDAETAREEPPPRRRQPEVPDPALDRNPQPRLAHPLARATPPARRLDRALQHRPRAHRDLRRDPAIHRRRLQGVGMDPCRNHTGTRALRPGQASRQTQKRHLAPAPAKKLEASPQPLKSTGR